jgi:hypothetical protein
MDQTTLDRYARYASPTFADGSPLPQGAPAPTPFLTGAERSLLERITDPSWDGPRRIEQERIPLDPAHGELVQALRILHDPTLSAGCQHRYVQPSPTSADEVAGSGLQSPA